MSRDAFSDSERRYFARRTQTDDGEVESETGLDRETIGLAALAAVGLGVAAGALVATAVAVLSTLVLVAGVARLRSSAPRTVAAGSVTAVLGLVGVVASVAVALPDQPIVPIAAVAVGATAAALRVESAATAFGRALRDSLVLGLVVGVAVVAITVGGDGSTWLVLASAADVLTATPFRAFATVLVLTGVALLSIDLVDPILESTPFAVPDGVPSMVELAERVVSLPDELYYVLALAGLLLFASDVPGAFEQALASLGPVGSVVRAVLVSGALHALVGSVILCSAVVLVGSALEGPARIWLGQYPLRTLAFGTGGGVLAAALALATVLPTSVPAERAFLGLYGLLAATLFAVVAIRALQRAVGTTTDRTRRHALALGAGATALSSAVAALEGVEPLSVFVGVAVAVLVWDIGENALTAGDQLGGVDTRELELVHATGSLLVGGLGVAVAAVATYVVGHVPPPTARWQAVAPLALALLAVTIFLLVVRGDALPWIGDDSSPSSESPAVEPTPSDPTPAGPDSSTFAEVYLFVGIVLVCLIYAAILAVNGQTFGASVAVAVAVPFAVLAMFDRLAAVVSRRW